MDSIAIGFKIHDGINFYWHFYVPSVVALLGWIFSRKEPWLRIKRISISIAFVGFVVFNLVALIDSYLILDAVVVELKKLKKSNLPQGILTATIDRLSMPFWKVGIAFHLVVDLIVLYFLNIWSAKKLTT